MCKNAPKQAKTPAPQRCRVGLSPTAAFFGALLLFLLLASPSQAQSDAVSDAVEALQRGDVTTAETILRRELRAHAQNSDALAVLAVVLDQEKKYSDADAVYKRALALSPHSAPLLNNYGNHLMATGKLDEARDIFLKLVAITPGHPNANLQLARIALARKSPAEAIDRLNRLPSEQPQEADVIRMQALFILHRYREAEALLDRLSAGAGSDPHANYSLGVALAGAGEYARAEDRLSRALENAPDNFDVLYNLGLAASHAGHNERARDILESALRRQPQNVDVLYDLAAVNAKLGQQEKTAQLLAQASSLAPNRADIQEFLARTTAELGYFGDSVRAWDTYLKSVPKDDVARRERAFAASAMGAEMARSLADLKAFTVRHPADAVGHYEFAIAEAATSPEDALREFDRALALKPDMAPAHIARGLLQFKQGRFSAALPDFEAALKQEPDNPVVLDRLGQTYMALDRSADAVPLLRRAVELAPRDSKSLLHLGRALANAGQEAEARAVFARFRELGPDQSAAPHPAGLVDFLSLSSEEQLARYRAGVERTVRSDPRNAEAQVLYLKLLLNDGKTAEAATVARTIIELQPSVALLEEAGNALLAAEEYALAEELLKRAAATDASGAVLLNLAIATSHAENPQAGLQAMDRIPQAQRTRDYFLGRAQILDACGRTEEAVASLKQGLHANPTRADLYRQAAAFLIERKRAGDALTLLEHGTATLPGNPDLLLMKVVALEAAGRTQDVEPALKTVEKSWPDWYDVWLARAIATAWQGRDDQARQMLQMAASLGSADANQRFKQALNPGEAPPDDNIRAIALMHALFP